MDCLVRVKQFHLCHPVLVVASVRFDEGAMAVLCFRNCESHTIKVQTAIWLRCEAIETCIKEIKFWSSNQSAIQFCYCNTSFSYQLWNIRIGTIAII